MTIQFPPKYGLLGVKVSATNYRESVSCIMDMCHQKRSGVVTALPVHGIITVADDPTLREAVNGFEFVVPDGQPVRWALNRLYGLRLKDRVYGPKLMEKLCRAAENEGVGIYLYGSTEEVLDKLSVQLMARFPALQINGKRSPPFRKMSQEELEKDITHINESGAGLVFVGLGCPKQDQFAAAHSNAVQSVLVCVGAAFDFLSENKKMAPEWMQNRGLEWLFRLNQEPGRLLNRYLTTNSTFIVRLVASILRGRR